MENNPQSGNPKKILDKYGNPYGEPIVPAKIVDKYGNPYGETPAEKDIVAVPSGYGGVSREEREKQNKETERKSTEEKADLVKFRALKEKVRSLNEKYKFEMEKETKANIWNQLEKANKELRTLEEKLDLESSAKSEIKPKEQETAPEVVKQKETETKTSEEERKPPVVPEEVVAKLKKKFKAGLIDITDVARSKARDAGDAEMTMAVPKNPEDLKGVKKFFKGEFWKRAGQKIWKHGLWRDYYRNKEITKARGKIFADENIFAGEGRGQDAHGKFVEDVMGQFTSEYEEVIHTDAGEKRLQNEEIANEQEVKEAIKKLIVEYASGRISKEAFKEQEKRLFKDLRADTEGKKLAKGEEIMHASNLFAIAEQVKSAMAVGEFLEGEDFDIDLIYGKSKGDVRTEAKFTKAEAWAERLSHTSVGQFVNETTLAASLSVIAAVIAKGGQLGSSITAKVLPFIGTALVSSGFAKLRESKKIEEERRQHAREMARGEKFDPARMERRREMEESRYQTQSAREIIDSLVVSNTALIENSASLTPEVLTQTLNALATVEAKIRLSDRRNIDLICYSDSAKIVEERKNLDIQKVKMKVALRKLFEAGRFSAPNGETFENYFNSLATTQENGLVGGDMNAKDRIFNKMKSKRSWQAARTAFATGLVIGAGAQEVFATFTNQTGIIEDAFKHNENLISGGGAITETGTHHLTALAQLKHYISDQWSGTLPVETSGGLHEAFAGSQIKLPDGSSLVPNPDGTYNLLSGDRVIAEHLALNSDGAFSPGAQTILHNSGVNMDTHLIGATTQQSVTVEEYIKNHPGQTHEMHRSWYDNDTVAFDENELRTNWGGENGTGIDKNGNYVLDVSHMTPDGSSHAGLNANAQELLAEGKLKMLVSLSAGTQDQVFELPINTDGHIIVDPNTEIGRIAFENVGGQAKFIGGFAEIGHDLGNNNFTMLSTVVGTGVDNITDAVPAGIPQTILGVPIQQMDGWTMPPFIPLIPRTPLEKLGMIEAAPYYMNYNAVSSEEQLAQFERMRSETLKENPEAKLDHYKEIDAYLKKLDPEYRSRIEKLAGQTEKMEKECKISICIPVAGHQEGKQIYESLKNYTYQTAKREEFELSLFVNHPEKDKEGNILNATEVLNEIERFKKDHPEIKLRVMYEVLPNEEARIGKIRKMLADATLIRQHERGEATSDLIMVSNDADNKGIDPRYIQTFLDKFGNNPEIDGLLGQLDWDPESYQKYPAIHIGTRLFQYLSIIGRRRSNSMVSSGANSAFRSSMFAGIGGYIDNLEGGEDISIGRAIIAARGGNKKRFGFAGAGTRLFTSSRRAIDAFNSGLAPVEQWKKGFSAFDNEIRNLTMEGGGKIDYKDEKTLEKIKKSLEYVINRTLNVWEGDEKLGKDAPYYKKALGWLGIKYVLDSKGDIKITDMTFLIRGLKKYQEEGKLMRDARSGKAEAKNQQKSKREKSKKNKPEEDEEEKITTGELERAVESFIDELPTHEEKINSLIKILNRSLDNALLQKLGLSITVEEIVRSLEGAKKIESGKEFIETVRSVLRPVSLAIQEKPEEFAKLKRRVFVEYHNFTPINEIFSYKVSGGDLHLHLAPAADLNTSQKIRLIKDALEKLETIISSNSDVKVISATSPLVTSNPGIFKRIGFKIEGPVSKEKQEKDFGAGSETASRATMSRKEFLDAYSSKDRSFKTLMLSWAEKLTRGK